MQAVVHAHAEAVLPFTISTTPLRPVVHMASFIGARIPVWDIRDNFGDTNLLVVNMAQGRDLARGLGAERVVLMRGHGFSAAGRSLRRRSGSRCTCRSTPACCPRHCAWARSRRSRAARSTPTPRCGPTSRRCGERGEYWAVRAGCRDLLTAGADRLPPASARRAAGCSRRESCASTRRSDPDAWRARGCSPGSRGPSGARRSRRR